MASPQLENGYTRLSNELLDKILEYPFTRRELKIVLKIIRDTYGWNIKKKQISFGQISKKIKIVRRNIITISTSLISRNILFKQKLKNNKNLWGINKDYGKWLMPDGSSFQEYEFNQDQKEEKPEQEWQQVWKRGNFPKITGILEDEINKLIKLYGEKEFISAIIIATKQNNKKLAYIEGILKRKKSGDTGDLTGKTKVSDGRWLTDEELAAEEMKGNIFYEGSTNKWIAKSDSK